MRTDRSTAAGEELLLIVGAGGHAQVAVDALLCDGATADTLYLVDDDTRLHGTAVLGVPVRGAVAAALHSCAEFHVAIGHNAARERMARACAGAGLRARTVRHPRATVAASASVGSGCFLAAGSIVGPSARVGEHCIVNHGAVVDHDCVVGAVTHIAPHAALGGAVCIGTRVLIGAGATLLPGVSVGDDCVVGAGAVVVSDVAAGAVVVGVPARALARGAR